MLRDNQVRNKRIKVNKNWRVDIREPLAAGRRPFVVVVGEFAYRSTVVDYPIHYNTERSKNYSPIAYDYPESIPQFVKDKVAALYEKFPILKTEVLKK